MKYIITESQIKNIIWNYFDSMKYTDLEDGGEIFLYNQNSSPDWGYTFDDGRLLVSNDIISTIEGLFNLSSDESLEYAGEWFEDRYGYSVQEILNWDIMN